MKGGKLTTGYTKAKGSKGISNPKGKPGRIPKSGPASISLPGNADTRPASSDRKQSAK